MTPPPPPTAASPATDPAEREDRPDHHEDKGLPRVVTFGCRLNTYESEVMRTRAANAGLGSETILVNTCAVTGEAERQARQSIRRLRRDNPTARLIVTGCGAQITPEAWAAMPEVDQVLGNRDKLDTASYTTDRRPPGPAPDQPPGPARVLVSDIGKAGDTAPHLVTAFGERTRAFLQVQQGCDHACTFCVIPLARGVNRSVPPDQVIAQARRLVDAGLQEVILTGVDIAGYGRDRGDGLGLGRLAALLLAALPDLPRLRLSSLDPVAIDADLIALLADNPRLMPHLHLSVQAGSDLILKRMKRRHTRAGVIALADRLRRLRPGLALGADLIAGFPTETEDQFADTLALIDEASLSHLHVFPFSPRPGTPAARMPQVARPVVKDRARRLRAAGAVALARFATTRVGTTDRVLVESPGQGFGESYLPVRLDPAIAPGRLVAVRLGPGDGTHLTGEAIP